MSIKLGYLVIENYNSYLGKHKINFKERQGNLVQIKGIDETDESSNGVGKSTIVDALVMAFFGRSLKKELNLDDLICNKSINPLRLELGFEDSSDGVILNTYVIERIRTRPPSASSKCSLFKNGKCISDDLTNTETQNEIEKIIGIDYSMFVNNNVLNPELFRLVKGGNSTKIDILERSLNQHIISKVFKVLSDVLKEDQEVYQKVDTEFYALKTSLSNLSQQNDNVSLHIQENINIITSNNKKLQEQIHELEAALDTINKKIMDIKPYVDKTNGELSVAKEEKIKTDQKITESKKILKYYEDNKTCYACKQNLPDRDSIIETEKLKSNTFSTEKQKLICLIEELELKPELDEYLKLNTHLSDTNVKLKEKRYNIAQNNKSIEKFKNITITSNSGKLEEVKEQIEKIKLEWQESKNTLEKTEFWKELLMPKSKTRMALAGELLKILNGYIQKYANSFYNKDFHFSFVINDNNIDEKIIKDGKKFKYDQLSSGERQKVDIVIVIALLDIAMSYFRNNKLKFLIVDEALDHLDPVWSKYVIEFMKSYAISMNMMCLFISHNSIVDEVDFLFDNKIIVKKNINGNSYIENFS
jgi:DNA repair exonuclease SbcCD ATPase subunit